MHTRHILKYYNSLDKRMATIYRESMKLSGHVYLCIGIIFAIAGGLLWWKQEKTRQLYNVKIFASIIMIIIGACYILLGSHALVDTSSQAKPLTHNVGWLQWCFIIGLIFIGSVSYTIAAFYHLKFKSWSFLSAFALALPLILIEYQFSIRGNFAAKDVLKLNAIQITLLTMTFYFVNAWVLNYFFLKQPVVWWREVIAFVCIILAFVFTTTIR
jgi:uncharacterized protein (DUF486 family)